MPRTSSSCPARRSLVFALLIAGASLAHAQQKTTETWVQVVIEGKRSGYSYFKIEPLANAQSRRSSVNVIQTRLMGQDLDLRVDSECVVDSSGNLIQGTYLVQSSGRATKTSLSVTETAVSVKVDVGGSIISRTVPLPAGGSLRDDPSFEMVTGRSLPNTFYVFDPQTTELLRNELRDEGAGKVVVVDPRAETSYELGANREFLRAKGPFGIEMTPATKEVALAEVGARSDLSNASAIPVEQGSEEFDPSAKAQWLFESGEIKIASDDHQTVTKQGAATVITIQPSAKIAPQLRIDQVPILDRKWIEGDLRIQPEDPEIRRVALQVQAGEKRLGATVRKMQLYVRQQVRVNAGIGVLRPATEVLSSQEGVCRDHAVLLASLLRSVGIQTRMVCGVVFDQGFLYYHAWVEIFDGTRWIGVDSTRMDESLSTGHIKTAQGSSSEASTGFLIPNARVRLKPRGEQ